MRRGEPMPAVITARQASAKHLRVEAIGLCQFHRPNPRVPFADSVGAVGELLDEGVIARAGISNSDVAQIDLADETLGGRLVSVQSQFSPWFRSSLAELEHCERRGMGFLASSPLGGIAGSAELASRRQVLARVAARLRS